MGLAAVGERESGDIREWRVRKADEEPKAQSSRPGPEKGLSRAALTRKASAQHIARQTQNKSVDCG